MIRVRGLLLILLIFISCTFVIKARIFDFGYDKAVSFAQEGKWEEAKDKFKELMVERSDNSDFLYDTGVASFEAKDFKQSAAYFKTVVENEDASDTLKEQAYFNLGNTNVELKNLKEAIENYENTLKINSANEKAKHNLEIVKKMLEQQKQQQKEQDKEQKEQKKDQKKDSQQQDKKEDKKGKDKSEDQEQKQQGQDGDKDKRDESSDKDKDKKDREQQRRDKKRPEDRKDDQRDKGKASEDELDKKKDSQQQKNRDEHDKKPDQKRQTKQHDKHAKDDKTKKDKDQEQQASVPTGIDKRKDLDERTLKILRAIEDMDKEGNKELMKATIGKEMVGKYGQNRW